MDNLDPNDPRLIPPPQPYQQGLNLPGLMPPQISAATRQAASAAPEQAPAQIAMPSMGDNKSPSMATPVMPVAHQTGKLDGTVAGDSLERDRLLSTGTGASQVHNPFLRGLAEFGSAVGHIAAPGLSAEISGTEDRHNKLLGQTNKTLGTDIGNQEKEAQTQNLNLQPQLKQAQGALAQEKQDEVERHHTAQEGTALAQHGYAMDEQNPGQIRPLRYEEMSESQQAVHDLKGAQQEEQEATAALKKAQNDPSSPAFRQAQQRIDNAKQTRAVAMERLGLSEKQFEMRAHGTEGGQPLPGSMITDSGQSVGTAFQQNVRPTGQERNKGDMANSAAQQIGDMKSIISKRPDIFGPAAGRTTDLQVWLGSQDPDAQRFRAARTIAGDHLAGTFGGRSEAALHALDNALGQFKDNPQAALAGLDQLAGATNTFRKAGTVKTAGSSAVKPQSIQGTSDVLLDDKGIAHRYKGTGSRSDPSNYDPI